MKLFRSSGKGLNKVSKVLFETLNWVAEHVSRESRVRREVLALLSSVAWPLAYAFESCYKTLAH